jgi:hypothetical protein
VTVIVKSSWKRTLLIIRRQKKNDIQYHFVRDMVEEKVLLEKIDTLKNVADSLTKSVSKEKFSWCRVTMGITALDR